MGRDRVFIEEDLLHLPLPQTGRATVSPTMEPGELDTNPRPLLASPSSLHANLTDFKSFTELWMKGS